MFQLVEQARKNQNNPMEMFKNATKNYSPEQMENLINRAKQFGVPTEAIKQVQEEIGKK